MKVMHRPQVGEEKEDVNGCPIPGAQVLEERESVWGSRKEKCKAGRGASIWAPEGAVT